MFGAAPSEPAPLAPVTRPHRACSHGRETPSKSSAGHSNAWLVYPASRRPESPESHRAVADVRAGLWQQPLRDHVQVTAGPAGLAAPAQHWSLLRCRVGEPPTFSPGRQCLRPGKGARLQPRDCWAKQTMSSAMHLSMSLPWNLQQGRSTLTLTPGCTPTDALCICDSQQGPGFLGPFIHFLVEISPSEVLLTFHDTQLCGHIFRVRL